MKVLVSDSISNVGIKVLKQAGIAVDVKAGINAEDLETIIENYDGLIVRSATKVTSRLLEKGKRLKVIVPEYVSNNSEYESLDGDKGKVKKLRIS